MLNKNQSKKWNSWKYALVFPALVAFVFLFQIEVIAQEKATQKTEKSLVKEDMTNIIITKNTTDEEIKNYCEELKKTHDINLFFFNIKRNQNGEIINIESEFKDKGGSGSCETSDNPIKPFKFYYDVNKKIMGYNMDLKTVLEEKEILMNSQKSNGEELAQIESKKIDVAKVSGNKNILVTINHISEKDTLPKKEKPIIILDGHKNHKLKVEDIQNIDPNSISQITVLKDENATNKYGEEGKNGVIEIITKEKIGKNGFSTKGYKLKDPKQDKKEVIQVHGFKAESLSINSDQKKVIFNSKNIDHEKILVIVDGKKTKTAVEDLNPDSIESINVLKDKSAEDKYGKEAKNGVIEITTKTSKK